MHKVTKKKQAKKTKTDKVEAKFPDSKYPSKKNKTHVMPNGKRMKGAKHGR